MSIPHAALPPFDATRAGLAGRLAAGDLLSRLAIRLAVDSAQPAPARPPHLEFHGEAGAPEGALFVDGELVGHVARVKRLRGRRPVVFPDGAGTIA